MIGEGGEHVMVVVDWPGARSRGGPYPILRDLRQSRAVSGRNGDAGAGLGQVGVDGRTGRGVGVNRHRVVSVVGGRARRVGVDCGSSGAGQHGVS